MLVKYIFVIQFSIFLDQEIAQTPLFRMRYDSLLNSKLRTAWPQAARKALRRYLFHDPSAWGSHHLSWYYVSSFQTCARQRTTKTTTRDAYCLHFYNDIRRWAAGMPGLRMYVKSFPAQDQHLIIQFWNSEYIAMQSSASSNNECPQNQFGRRILSITWQHWPWRKRGRLEINDFLPGHTSVAVY